MSRRLDVRPIFRGQWRGLTRGVPPNVKPDWISRVVLLGAPLAVLVAALVWDWQMQAPAALLSGVSLLAAGLLSSFTYLTTLRMKVSEWSEHENDRWSVERAMLDETAAHVVAAVLACIVEAVLIVVGMNVSDAPQNVFGGVLGAVALAVAAYIAIMFVVALPRLYNAYVELNNVSTELSGFTRGKL